ncbi:MAG: restriction endonuclease [Candidatus Dadabacteria bacterium]|nr:restriction endonuclease [Candidatus Dadabacteria bacterium]
MESEQIPSYDDLLWPTLKALEARGGSASIQEISEQIAFDLDLSESILSIPHKQGYRSEVDYRAAWARTMLKRIGAVKNSLRGIWAITEAGRDISTEEEVRKRVSKWRRQDTVTRRKGGKTKHGEGDSSTSSYAQTNEDEQDWVDELLENIRSIKPEAFERLCQRILREAGFIKVEVTGRSGDGGIDGAGILRVNLLSFHIRFQCKRYSGSVSASEIRNFRGALVGRADKGLFITTGRFTKDAEREAVRDGAPAIDLINGVDFCYLLKKFGLGVRSEPVEIVKPQPEFFENF